MWSFCARRIVALLFNIRLFLFCWLVLICFVFFVLQKFFLKKLVFVLIASSSNDVYAPQLLYGELFFTKFFYLHARLFICENLFLFMTFCENLLFFARTISYPWSSVRIYSFLWESFEPFFYLWESLLTYNRMWESFLIYDVRIFSNMLLLF